MTATATTPRANAAQTTNGFWWANLSSTDDGAAAAFYARVFGWEYHEMPIGERMVHRNAHIGGRQVAGIDPMMPGVDQPSAWTNFVFVDYIHASAERARELGATVVMEPIDVMGEGHMAVLLDPTGAAFGLWQPGRHTGADAVNQPGTYTWVELSTTDPERARSFYADLFGWTFEQYEQADYWLAGLEGRQFAGLMQLPDEMSDRPSHWGTYFGVADVEAAADEVRAAGGTVLFGPMRMGPGIGFGAVDPTGAYFLAIQLDEWSA